MQAVSEEKEVLCGQHTTDIGKKHPKRYVRVPEVWVISLNLIVLPFRTLE